METIDKRDITERAVTGGWVLPQGWAVQVDLSYDHDVRHPADEGEAYEYDFDVAEDGEACKGFCRGCDRVIVRGRELWYDGTRVVCPDDNEESSVWIECDACEGEGETETGGECEACQGHAGWPGHVLAESKAVQAWRRDDWTFGVVSVWVQDSASREWGRSVLGGVEFGRFPLVAMDGTVTRAEVDPLDDKTGEYSVTREHDMIGEALREAVAQLAAFGTPVIVEPKGITVSGL